MFLTDSLIHGIASSWSKALLAASMSTVKAPASNGCSLVSKAFKQQSKYLSSPEHYN